LVDGIQHSFLATHSWCNKTNMQAVEQNTTKCFPLNWNVACG